MFSGGSRFRSGIGLLLELEPPDTRLQDTEMKDGSELNDGKQAGETWVNQVLKLPQHLRT